MGAPRFVPGSFAETMSPIYAWWNIRAFNARHPTRTPFHTDVLAMNHTPTILAWACTHMLSSIREREALRSWWQVGRERSRGIRVRLQ